MMPSWLEGFLKDRSSNLTLRRWYLLRSKCPLIKARFYLPFFFFELLSTIILRLQVLFRPDSSHFFQDSSVNDTLLLQAQYSALLFEEWLTVIDPALKSAGETSSIVVCKIQHFLVRVTVVFFRSHVQNYSSVTFAGKTMKLSGALTQDCNALLYVISQWWHFPANIPKNEESDGRPVANTEWTLRTTYEFKTLEKAP